MLRLGLCVRALMGAALVSSVPLAIAGSAAAQDSGVEAGLRLGYGVPLGTLADGGGDLSDGVSGQLPVWLDLGYRFAGGHFMVGLYGHYGFASVGDDLGIVCDQTSLIDCYASDIRIGLQAHYHVMPSQSIDPWFGLGIGYEWMTIGFDGGGAEFSMTASGPEFANLQFGVDFLVTQHFVLGPVISFSLGHYDGLSVDCTGNALCNDLAVSGDIEETSLHEWLVLAVRGAYVP